LEKVGGPANRDNEGRNQQGKVSGPHFGCLGVRVAVACQYKPDPEPAALALCLVLKWKEDNVLCVNCGRRNVVLKKVNEL
jgi:hypothetical protein